MAAEDEPMVQNEIVLRSGNKIAIGSEWWEIRDSGEPVKFSDIITEARHINGVIYLSFAAGIHDANNKPFADINHRIRMNLGSAQFLHQLLDGMIKDALKPVDPSKAN